MFSVIMPVYNGEKHLKESIESVLNQTYKFFELIAVDDGSTDKSLEILNKFAAADDRVKVYSIPNSGVSAARNYGLKKAEREYVLFIDCDDTWDKDLLKTCEENGRGKSVLFGIKKCFYDDGVLIKQEDETSDFGKIYNEKIDVSAEKLFLKYNMASPCNKVYLRSIIEENGIGFSESCVYLEDLKFNLDYYTFVDEIVVIDENLYNYRLENNGNQIFKRKFKSPFVNADELSRSFDAFSYKKMGKGYDLINIFVSIVIKTYMDELRVYVVSGNYRKKITLLIKNECFLKALKKAEGKFYFLLRIAFKLHLKGLIGLLVRSRG